MVPAMLASLVGNTQFGDAHDVAQGSIEVEALVRRCYL